MIVDDIGPSIERFLGTIVDVCSRKDGAAKVVTVKTNRAYFKRPVTKLESWESGIEDIGKKR